jgi:hypothetical protein
VYEETYPPQSPAAGRGLTTSVGSHETADVFQGGDVDNLFIVIHDHCVEPDLTGSSDARQMTATGCLAVDAEYKIIRP